MEKKVDSDMELRDQEESYEESQQGHELAQYEKRGYDDDDEEEDEEDDEDDEVMRILKGLDGRSKSGPTGLPAEQQTQGVTDGQSSSTSYDRDPNDRINMPQEPGTGNNIFMDGPNDWSFDDLDVLYPQEQTGTAQASRDSLSSASTHQQKSGTSSPHLAGLPSRKRPRNSSGTSYAAAGRLAPKSMRYTPSPAVTAPTTPSSPESFELPDDPEFIRLTGGNPQGDMEDFRKTQKELMDRYEKERESEELARKLTEDLFSQDHLNNPSTQSMLSSDGRVTRPMQPPPARNDPTATASSHNASNLVLPARTTQSPYVQPGWQSSTPLRRSTMNVPGGFVDLGSDSSDLEEIDPTDFRNSGRRSQTQTATSWGSPARDSNGFNLRNGYASVPHSRIEQIDGVDRPSLFGVETGNSASGAFNSPYNHGASSSLGWQGPSWLSGYPPTIGQGLRNAAQGVRNAAYSLLDAQINSYPDAPLGLTDYPMSGSPNNSQAAGSASNRNLFGYPPPYGINPAPAPGTSPAHMLGGQELSQSYWDRYDYLTNDPTRTREEIKSLLENIRPDEDLPENREGDPEAMKYPLMPHQKLGLAWMKSMEEGSNKGGILADDMGLGKTIQALALMVSRKSTDPSRKTNLIVAPVALMKQWESEIQRKLKGGHHAMSTYILHGSKRDTTFTELKKFDVVLTTFGTLANELKRKEAIDMKKKVNRDWRPNGKADRLPLLGDECKWYRVIVDEAQCIKNKSTRAAQAACHLQALTRFCMSGTPMMNNVGELYSLIHFLRIKPYNESERFNRDFSRPLKGNVKTAKDQAMRKLQALLKAILLRRTKKSMIDGKPILNLPERTTEHQHAVFSEDEQAFYQALESKTQLQFNKYLKAGTVGRNYSNVLVLLLRLRQACCHPHLITDFGVLSSNPDVSMKDMLALAAELAPEVVDRIKSETAFECPVCYDGVDNPAIFIPCGHSTCSECFARISDPAQGIAQGVEDNTNIKCPNCRGRIVPSKVTDYNAFKQVHMAKEEACPDPEAADEAGEDGTASDSGSDDEDSDEEDADLDGFVVGDDIGNDGSETESDHADEEGYRRGKTPFERSKSADGSRKERMAGKKDRKGKGKAKESKAPRKTLAQLKAEGMRNSKARKRYMRRLERDWVTSAKIEKTMEILSNVQNNPEGEKTIIFSQFTSLLDLLEIPIARKKWGFRRYDGSMSSTQRNDAVLAFTDKPECRIMLVSLKAGNAGLNLVAASQVIIFDPFWNPYIEEQAIDRAHRIGQMRPVRVHRVLVENTVEDRILALQDKKRQLIEGALDEKASQNIGRLGTRELAFLFGVSH